MPDTNTTIIKTETFRDSVRKKAEAEINRILDAAKKESESILEKAREDCMKQSFETIAQRSAQIMRDAGRRTARANADAEKAVLHKRAMIVDEFFLKIRDKLVVFTETPEYAKFFEHRLEQAFGEKKIYNWVIIYVREKDVKLAEPFADKYQGLHVQPSTEITLGGFILHFQKERQYLDKTLDRFLEREKENFIFRQELVIRD